MAQRPVHIDLSSELHDGAHSRTSSPGGHPSPRIFHVAGDVPPAMSPLDAFAAQSRFLAKQLEDSKKNGRRASRLPPLTVASSLASQRPGYFRSLTAETRGSANNQRVKPLHEEVVGDRREVATPVFRPQSFYPRMSTASPVPDSHAPTLLPLARDQTFMTPTEYRPSSQGDYFGVPRAHSPESVTPLRKSIESADRSSITKFSDNYDSAHRSTSLRRDISLESNSSRAQYTHTLLAPKPPFLRQTPSVRSVTIESSDEEHSAYTPGSSFSQDRKYSGSSGVSMPHSPLSPFAPPPHIRSPSANSDYSTGGSRLSRPTFNFSRPLSRSSRPSTESPSRQLSTDSQPSLGHNPVSTTISTTTSTPVSIDKEEYFDPKEQQPPPVESYIHAKYSLPRGRMLGRDSIPLENMMPQFEWETDGGPSNVTTNTPRADGTNLLLPTPPHSLESERPSLDSPGRASAESYTSRSFSKSSEQMSANSYESKLDRAPPVLTFEHQHRQSMTSMNSGSTIKAPQRAAAISTELSAEDHLSKGIDCHERGSLKESTYHLRIAARQNNPTAMLLYALACRHGWGMRPNPQEGVQWLRKAMDCASLELEIDQDAESRGRHGDVTERKTRRAQFALSVYELGVSHMNGWGIEQDKKLALRCFEIASDWGDADAMAEAGFCYAQGVGCKKDLKKAARYYRSAEAKGMSMVGNSWYIILPLLASDHVKEGG